MSAPIPGPRRVIPLLRQIRLQTLRRISCYLPPPNQLTSGDGTRRERAQATEIRAETRASMNSPRAFRDFLLRSHTRIGEKNKAEAGMIWQTSTTQWPPLGQTVGLQYTCTTMGVNYKFFACKKKKRLLAGRYSRRRCLKERSTCKQFQTGGLQPEV